MKEKQPKFRRLFLLGALFCVASSFMMNAQSADVRRFAVVIGINQYSDSTILQLAKAQNDAADLAALLTKAGGFKAVKLMSGNLLYGDPLFPSRDNISAQISQLAEIVQPGDHVLFFFSGHGLNDAKTGDSWLLPIDTKAANVAGTAVNLQRDVLAPLAAAGVSNVVALLDACQKTFSKDKGLSVVGVNEVKSTGKAVVITATGPGKASYEDPKGANGIFTRALLAGLQGEADRNADGQITLDDLEKYLPTAVSEYAFSVNMVQKPVVYDTGSDAARTVLIKLATTTTGNTPAVASAKAQFVQFKLPDGVRADLRILDASGRELQVISDTTGVSPRLEPGSYRVEAQDRLYQYYAYSYSFVVGNAKQTVNLELKPNFGSLKVSADPVEGVDVLINGEKKGTITGGILNIERLKSGNYTLVLSKTSTKPKASPSWWKMEKPQASASN